MYSVINSNGVIGTVTNASQYFTPGDRVWLTCIPSSYDNQYTVVQVSSNSITVEYAFPLSATMVPPNGTYVSSIQVVKSGYANLQKDKAGTLVAKDINGFTPYVPSGPVVTTSTSYSFDSIIDAKAVEYNDVWGTLCNANSQSFPSGGGEGTPVTTWNSCNEPPGADYPYNNGSYGIWRPYKSWAYVTGRTQNGDIRTDGVYTDFTKFPWPNEPFPGTTKWVNSNTITSYSQYGFELENENAVGVYSAAVYGYDNTLVKAVGSNARYHEIAFDGFEDYPPTCLDNDFSFTDPSTGTFVIPNNAQAHTGNFSIRVLNQPYNYVFVQKGIFALHNQSCPVVQPSYTITEGGVGIGTGTFDAGTNYLVNNGSSNVPADMGGTGSGGYFQPPGGVTTGGGTTTTTGLTTAPPWWIIQEQPPITWPFNYSACDCIGEFWPFQDSTYVISAWAKEIPFGAPTGVNSMITYTAPEIEIDFFDASNASIGTPFIYQPSGNIIEGWQRFYQLFKVPSNAASIIIKLVNNSAVTELIPPQVYFDDVRVHPYKSNLNTYVYDYITLKVMAELDPNNYATFYNYDDEGHLTKIKKETVAGISTIKEGRINDVEK